MLCCPVCSCEMNLNDTTYICKNGHCFDLAKEGYVNLLLVNRHKSKTPGDNSEMSLARRNFLSKGYYAPLARKIASLTESLAASSPAAVLDACCGEGYYTNFIKNNVSCNMYAFDISKSMIKLAAKQNKSINYFVAGINNIPVFDKSFDIITHLFALFDENEFSRILKSDGSLISVSPGSEHLWELKKLLYKTPYKNDEKTPELSKLKVTDTIHLRYPFTIKCNEDLQNLFMMTPYYYKTSSESASILNSVDSMEITADFLIHVLKTI